MKMKIAVCDDERKIRVEIGQKIKKLYPETEVFLFESGTALLRAPEAFDLIFLDIQMEGINGIDTARKLRGQGSDAVLIFITALKEYVFEAFDVEAFHYLVKPFTNARFFEVLHMAVEKREKERRSVLNHQDASAKEKSILIKTGRTTSKVYVRDILYAEVYNRKITLHMTEGELEFYGQIRELEKQLGEAFFRCHRAYLIHLRYVLKYDANSILLENGQTINMAKQKYEAFVKRYFDYARKENGEKR